MWIWMLGIERNFTSYVKLCVFKFFLQHRKMGIESHNTIPVCLLLYANYHKMKQIKIVNICWTVMAHAFNPSLRPAQSTEYQVSQGYTEKSRLKQKHLLTFSRSAI